MATSTIQQPIPIKMASQTITNKSATVVLDDGYTMANTIILGIECKNATGTVINTQGTQYLSQCRWSAARTGIYFLFNVADYDGGTAVVYYIKAPNKYAFT